MPISYGAIILLCPKYGIISILETDFTLILLMWMFFHGITIIESTRIIVDNDILGQLCTLYIGLSCHALLWYLNIVFSIVM